tara:strand:- start:1112 stop:1591 length:480 start_codon:yes stop_codon:yes gene_type:complete
MELMSNLSKVLEDEIISLNNLIFLLDEAARTERFLSKPRHPGTPSMYDLLITSYDKKDIGYYEKTLIKLRATPKQITRWEFAIDALLAIETDISKDPILDRQIVWMRANRFKWTQVGRHFGFNRISIKNRYMTILSALTNKIKKNHNKYCKLNRILYLI